MLLLIEVSDSALAFDQGVKRALYARHGIAEYWIVDIPGQRIQVHRDPLAGSYRFIQEFAGDEPVSPLALALAQVQVSARELFG